MIELDYVHIKNDPQKLNVVEDYCSNNMKKLKQICDPLILRKGVPQMFYDDLYCVAADVLIESLKSYDESAKTSFKTFLTGNIKRAFYDWTRDSRRGKRCNLERDSRGRIRKDENGNSMVIHDISIDAPTEDGIDIAEKIDSGYRIEDNLEDEMGFSSDDRVEKFMLSLSDLQRDILRMKMSEIPAYEIKKSLAISNSEYNDAIESIKANRLICLFNKGNVTDIRNTGGERKVKQKVVINENDLIMDLDTTDNHTVDVRSVESLLRDKDNGELDCNYISQRDALQWSDEQANKFLSRVLNNQPIPEIVICETDQSLYGEKISYLVEGLQRISYAEEFRENRIPVKANGAEFTKIKYKKFEYGKDGKISKDENGRAVYTIDIFDITGKYYKELPEYLQKRFDNYNISVTRFFNCTYELIDYHIRNYNNHEGMTKSHYGITSVSNKTSTRIKSLSRKNPFFVNNVKYTNKAKKRGVVEEMVARSMMATFFIDDWKKESIEVLKYIDREATEEQFSHFEENANRLAKVSDKSVKDMFNTTNIHVWMAAFDKFTTYKGFNDEKFIEFMLAFASNLHDKNINGRSYDDVNKRNTRDKSTVKNKISVLIDLMEEWLGITDENRTAVEDIEKFIAECTGEELDSISEDIVLYNQSLDELMEIAIRFNSKLRDTKNRPSLLSMMVYSYKEDVDLEDWLTEYAENNSTYLIDQKENYLHMKESLQKYIKQHGAAA